MTASAKKKITHKLIRMKNEDKSIAELHEK